MTPSWVRYRRMPALCFMVGTYSTAAAGLDQDNLALEDTEEGRLAELLRLRRPVGTGRLDRIPEAVLLPGDIEDFLVAGDLDLNPAAVAACTVLAAAAASRADDQHRAEDEGSEEDGEVAVDESHCASCLYSTRSSGVCT